MRFNFTGTIGAITDEGSKGYFSRSGSKNGEPYESVNFSVSSAKNNRGYVELFGMKSDTIHTTDSDGNKFDVAWDDRNDEDIVKDVANYRKNIVTLKDGERHEYISAYDAVQEVRGAIPDMVGKKFTITGNVSKNIYNGKMSDRFQISNIYVASEESKPRLSITGEFFFTKDSIDCGDWNDSHKLTITGWSQEYIKDEKKRMYCERQCVFDCSKIDFNNEQQRRIAEFRLKYLGIALKGDKITVKLDAKKVYKINATFLYQNGAEEIEFDESELTESQKEAIALGLKTLDDFRPVGASIYGNRITVLKLIDMDMRAPYDSGCVALDDSVDEFMEDVYKLPSASDDPASGFMPISEEVDKEIEDLFS